MKKFTYRKPFGIRFRNRHKVNNHNNQTHATIYLEGKWATKLWPNRNFAWYFVVSGVNVSEGNISLASGNFQNNGLVQPSLNFRIALEI